MHPEHTSEAGVSLIEHFESCRLKAYWDPHGKCWTIGWGHTGLDVYEGLVITQAVADAMLAQDLIERENAVKKFFASVPLTRGEFDALVSFLYNVGPGKRGIKSGLFVLMSGQVSTLARKVLARDYAGAAEEFPKWIYAGGVPLRGLERRRKAERQLFLTGAWL
ncbi:lysozyme [Achromobacter seleniivolatilans]|uniref:Lysozyme n=1 Tax=Achromobacter seleniivolatilans TaxID=3047478 RepID=A0ABY9MA56_9BURK|nr:lysozyme [Achromobacter sp. R39]WMD23083.1 lysozyme [Achromobacter sp. R39]